MSEVRPKKRQQFSLNKLLGAVALLGAAFFALQQISKVPQSDEPFVMLLALSLICGSVGFIFGGWRGLFVAAIGAVLVVLLLCGIGSAIFDRVFTIPPQGTLWRILWFGSATAVMPSSPETPAARHWPVEEPCGRTTHGGAAAAAGTLEDGCAKL